MRAIITADWHIRATRPRCRIDEEWVETQRKALNQIFEVANKKQCNVYCVGDIFHSNSDTSFECISMVQDFSHRLTAIGRTLGVLAGNHDLPYHSSENIGRSAIGVLLDSYNIGYILDSVNDEKQSDISASNFDEKDNENAKIVFKHILTIPSKDKPNFVDSETPESLLQKFRNAKWIFTGDYHHNFHYEKNGRHVVNSGCLLRQVSDMKDYQCGVYFVDTDENIVEFIPIIDSEDLIDDSYILQENERNERIESFVDKLKRTKGVSLDFIENVQNEMKHNGFESELIQVVDELLEVNK